MKKNSWLLVMLALLLGLAVTNAFINYEMQAWADLAFSLSMICILVPIPDNIKFITAKLQNEYFRSKTVAVLHSAAAFAFVGGVLGKVI